jgi:hypothetical protein
VRESAETTRADHAMRRPSTPLAAALLAALAGALAPAALASDPPCVPAPAPAPPAPAPAGLMYEPRFREGKPGDVLADATSPLLRGDLDAFVDLFEAAYDVALSPAGSLRRSAFPIRPGSHVRDLALLPMHASFADYRIPIPTRDFFSSPQELLPPSHRNLPTAHRHHEKLEYHFPRLYRRR